MENFALSYKFPSCMKFNFSSSAPVTNCGFIYLLFTCVFGLVGLILFSITAKKYKYRERNEGMFRQMDIEEIFEREIEQASMDSIPGYKTL